MIRSCFGRPARKSEGGSGTLSEGGEWEKTRKIGVGSEGSSAPYRGTSFMRNVPPAAPYSGPMPRDLW